MISTEVEDTDDLFWDKSFEKFIKELLERERESTN
jgi:hypothetical protein